MLIMGEELKRYEVNGKLWGTFTIPCRRCGGSGHYSRDYNGCTTCYRCQGKKYEVEERRILSDKEIAQREKARERRKQKKLKEQEEYLANKQREAEEKRKRYSFICVDKDSYQKKDLLKENGYKWRCRNWIGSIEIDNVELLRVSNEAIIDQYGEYMPDVIIELVQSHSLNTTSHFGEVGAKVEIEVIIKKIIEVEDRWGTKLIYLMEDNEGHLFKWATKSGNLDKDKPYKVKATIKSHEEYKGVNQTTLIRVKPV